MYAFADDYVAVLQHGTNVNVISLCKVSTVLVIMRLN